MPPATSRAHARPLSPHLQVWKWGPHMLVSILHRATGSAMATLATVLLCWWLIAAATGADAYRNFIDLLTVSSGGLNIVGWVLGIGFSWAFFQHMATGVRHLVLDTGAGYELRTNKLGAVFTMVFSVLATIAFWALVIWGRG